MQENIFIVCRETNKYTGEVTVYDVGFVDKSNSLSCLQLRT